MLSGARFYLVKSWKSSEPRHLSVRACEPKQNDVSADRNFFFFFFFSCARVCVPVQTQLRRLRPEEERVVYTTRTTCALTLLHLLRTLEQIRWKGEK